MLVCILFLIFKKFVEVSEKDKLRISALNPLNSSHVSVVYGLPKKLKDMLIGVASQNGSVMVSHRMAGWRGTQPPLGGPGKKGQRLGAESPFQNTGRITELSGEHSDPFIIACT